MAKYKVLSTKKLDPSLIEKAKVNDIYLVEKEFISIKPVWNKETYDRILTLAKQGQHHIVLTSANAVDVLNRYMVAEDELYAIGWKVFCLSGKTKKALQSAPFLKAEIVDEAESAASLAKKIIEREVKELIFFCGNKRREELPGLLKDAGIKLHEIVVYETEETPAVIEDAFDAILFFSPSGVQSFFTANELKKNTVCFAIGPTTSASITTFAQNKILSSIAPDPATLLDEVIEHFKNKVESHKA
jgi:uroporphyrinogen-III synthase